MSEAWGQKSGDEAAAEVSERIAGLVRAESSRQLKQRSNFELKRRSTIDQLALNQSI